MTSLAEASTVPVPRAPSTHPPSSGLTAVDAKERLATHGPNELARAEATSAWRMLLAQFESPVIWLLLGACIVSGALGEVVDAIVIGAMIGSRQASASILAASLSEREYPQTQGSCASRATALHCNTSVRRTGSSRAPISRSCAWVTKKMRFAGESSRPTTNGRWPFASSRSASISLIAKARAASTRTRRSRNQTPFACAR
jgi:Cation transporter/ATPase, N-terminus